MRTAARKGEADGDAGHPQLGATPEAGTWRAGREHPTPTAHPLLPHSDGAGENQMPPPSYGAVTAAMGRMDGSWDPPGSPRPAGGCWRGSRGPSRGCYQLLPCPPTAPGGVQPLAHRCGTRSSCGCPPAVGTGTESAPCSSAGMRNTRAPSQCRAMEVEQKRPVQSSAGVEQLERSGGTTSPTQRWQEGDVTHEGLQHSRCSLPGKE